MILRNTSRPRGARLSPGAGTTASRPSSPVGGAAKAARRAAIEKSKAIYYKLGCGCFCPHEVHELYKIFEPITGGPEVFCERHGEFTCVEKLTPREDHPQDELPF